MPNMMVVLLLHFSKFLQLHGVTRVITVLSNQITEVLKSAL